MEFKVYQKELELQSRGWIPTFHDVSREVVEIVKESGIKNGTGLHRVPPHHLLRHDPGVLPRYRFVRSGIPAA